MTMLEKGINRYVYRVQSSEEAFLILSQIWYPGWVATLDGAPLALYRTNHALLGTALPCGDHELVLEMQSIPLRVGIALFIATGFVSIYLILRPLSRKAGL